MENELGQAKRMSARLQAQLMEAAMRGAGAAPPPASTAAAAASGASGCVSGEHADKGGEQDTTGRSEVHQLRKVCVCVCVVGYVCSCFCSVDAHSLEHMH
jgi:hypothetical protein